MRLLRVLGWAVAYMGLMFGLALFAAWVHNGGSSTKPVAATPVAATTPSAEGLTVKVTVSPADDEPETMTPCARCHDELLDRSVSAPHSCPCDGQGKDCHSCLPAANGRGSRETHMDQFGNTLTFP